MKKGDWILTITVLFVALSLWGGLKLTSYLQQQDNLMLIVKSEGKVVQTLEVDATTSASYQVENQFGYNLIWVRAGVVTIHESDCKNQLCVGFGGISKSGESLVCLPHRVIVELKGTKALEVDAVSQ